ncbi:type 1 fimbrial protein [Yokenella regensburgei]
MSITKPLYASSWGTDCSYDTKIINIEIPSGKKVTLDPNAPVGTVFFEHFVAAQAGQNFKCQTANSYSLQGGYLYGSGGQTVAMSGGGLVSQSGSTYPVYKTNVPGIGLVVRYSGSAFPYWWGTYSYTNRVLDYTGSMTQVFDIDIVKYGDIPAGSRTVVIDSTVISSINSVVRITNSGDASRMPNGNVLMAQFVLSPSTFDIVSGTCDTPDMTINLGSHSLKNLSNREGNKFVSPWTDASIHLTHCPVFYGTGERSSNKDTVRNNMMTVTLIPGNATTSNQGIMPVDSGGLAATGVGIQLAYGTSASPQLVDLSTGKGTKTYTMSSTQGPTYTIPLVARYIQTAGAFADIVPGKANGKVTYLINYY